MDYLQIIEENNKTHVVDATELPNLITQSSAVFKKHFSNDVWLERSVFTNWTCGIADCKYCYLSTKPKMDKAAVRRPESILAEILICREMGWDIGYITGGLRVESTEYIVALLNNISKVLGKKIMMNYGPYTRAEVLSFAPHLTGMGCAIESFDPDLHAYICPSKPLTVLMKFLGYVRDAGLQKLITIILGIGEKKSDVDEVIKYIGEYKIEKVQLCFLKAQEGTVFDNVPAPNMDYMAWWVARLRIACPTLVIKIAVVSDRIENLSLLLDAGANCFSRYMIFDDFNSPLAVALEKECAKAGRVLKGNFTKLPAMNIPALVEKLDIPSSMKASVVLKAEQYYRRLKVLTEKRAQV